jgi:hypothetical protein
MPLLPLFFCTATESPPPPTLFLIYLDIKPYRLGDVIRDKTLLLLLPISYYSLHSKFNRYSSFFFSLLFSSDFFFAFFFEVALGRFHNVHFTFHYRDSFFHVVFS